MKYLYIFSFFLILACATRAPSKSITVTNFPYWIPFEYGISYSGKTLPDPILEGDRFLVSGKYESAYLRYTLSQKIPANFRQDLAHRIFAILILLRQPLRALDYANSPSNYSFFRNPEGSLLRTKALFEINKNQHALEESEKLLRSGAKTKILRKLEYLLLEQRKLGRISESLDMRKYPKVALLLGQKQEFKDTSNSQEGFQTTFEIKSQNICALLPLSGSVSNIGSKIANGVSVAFEKNQDSGLKLFIKDVGSSTQDFEYYFNSLNKEITCDYYLGPFILEQAKTFQGLNSGKKFTIYLSRKDPGGNFGYVHLGLTLRSQVLGILDYISKSGFSKILVVKTSSQYSQEFSEEILKYSRFKVVDYQINDLNQQTIATLEKDIIRGHFDAVILGLTISETAELLMGLSDKTKSLVQFIGTGLLDDKKALSQVPYLLENVVYPTFLNEKSSKSAEFISLMKAKHLDSSIDIFSALGFEAAELTIGAYQRFGTLDSRAIYQMAQIREGIMGRYNLEFFPSLERILDVISVKDKIS